MSTAVALSSCVTSLRSSMQLLESSIEKIAHGVSDYPRLTKVLSTTSHYELVSEAELRSAQDLLTSEIQPEVESLLARVDAYLDKMERREKSLIAKNNLQKGRLREPVGSSGSSAAATTNNTRGFSSGRDAFQESSNAPYSEDRPQPRQNQDRLSYAVGRLEQKASARERQLRKSMAPDADF